MHHHHPHNGSQREADLRPYAWLSLIIALLTFALKAWGFLITDSLSLLSDTLETLINISSGISALIILRIAMAPPDEEHPHGHDKAEYFFSALEGSLILIAAIGISCMAIDRLVHPHPILLNTTGFLLISISTLLNFVTAHLLLRQGRRKKSLTLESNGQHIMSDVWTSLAVLAGIVLVHYTHLMWMDSLCALGIALFIFRMGTSLLGRSIHGLMDHAFTAVELERLEQIISQKIPPGSPMTYHALRTRVSAQRSFISFHLLVPGAWTVQQSHDLIEAMEQAIVAAFPWACILIHPEPLEDHRSYDDLNLDHLQKPPSSPRL